MKDRGIFSRAAEAVEFLDIVQGRKVSVEITQIFVGLAKAQATLILAESQRLLAETLAEANELKRIELKLENPQPGGVANAHDSIPDLSGQRPPDAPAR